MPAQQATVTCNFDSNIESINFSGGYNANFTSNGQSITADAPSGAQTTVTVTLKSGFNLVSVINTDGGINIPSPLTNPFTTEIIGNLPVAAEYTLNFTSASAGPTYEYVAMQEVPTPTTADNGKVLGVANGEYALQEASGGQLYQHNIRLKNTTKDFSSSRVYFSFINDVASPYTTVIQVAMALASMNLTLSSEGGLPATGLYSAYSDRVMCVVGSKGGSLTVIINTGSTISMQSSPSDEIVDYVTQL